MTHSYHIRKSFSIEDPNIFFNQNYVLPDKTMKKVTYKRFRATLTYTPKACEKCGVVNENYTVIKNGTKTSTIKLGNVLFQPALLLLRKQRFLCKACKQTFSASTTLVRKHCFISNLIKRHIAWELQEIQSMKAIASRCAVSSHTVIRILRKAAQTLEPKKTTLPDHLSFDEFKSVKAAAGAMSFIFTNAQTHEPVDIVENRQQAELLAYFQRYPYKERAQVKTVTLDMYAPYLSLIKQCFPNAQLIIDRFHVVQHVNRALNRFRVEIMNGLRYSQPRDYRKLKKQWKLILKNSWTLDFERFFTHRLYDGLMSEKMMADYLVSLDPQFQWVYDLINDLKYSLSEGNFDRFRYHLTRSRERSVKRYIRTVFQTLENYLEPIRNAFVYTLSNGHLEGINNKIKTMKRSGYGYRNFYNLRARILISFKLTEDADKRIRPLYREDEKQTA